MQKDVENVVLQMIEMLDFNAIKFDIKSKKVNSHLLSEPHTTKTQDLWVKKERRFTTEQHTLTNTCMLQKVQGAT